MRAAKRLRGITIIVEILAYLFQATILLRVAIGVTDAENAVALAVAAFLVAVICVMLRCCIKSKTREW